MRWCRMSCRFLGLAVLFSATGCGAADPEPPPAQMAHSSAQSNPVASITVADARSLIRSGALLIDVREPSELAESGWLEGSLNRPMSSFAERARELPRDRPIILYCRSGRRSGIAGDMLTAMGFTNVYNLGAFKSAASAGLPTRGR